MKRIAVVGCAGSGKTTLALELGRVTGLPVIHLDAHYWRPGWVEPAREEWIAQHLALLTGPEWIADGNYGSTLDARFRLADTVIDMNARRLVCLARVIGRAWRHRGFRRPDVGCTERLDLGFLLYLLRFPERSRPRLEHALTQARLRGVNVVSLHGGREVAAYLDSLQGG